jgi:hypothetical protein
VAAQKALFLALVLFLAAGLAYFIVLGLAHR